MSAARLAALSELFHARADRLVADLGELVKRESPSEDAAKVTALASWIALRLTARGVSAETVPCPPRGHAVRAVRFVSGGLTGHGGSSGAGGTLLVGHLDTVWPVGALKEIPFGVKDGVARGPGSFDMKAGIAVAMTLLEAIAQGEVRPVAPVALLLVPDEEIGSDASRELIVAEARKRDRVLVLEPSADGGAAKVARKGIGLVEARFTGISSHAGLDPEKGASALAEMARYVLHALSLANPALETTVVPTLASAGTKTNVVPEKASVSVDYRVWTGPEGERVTAALKGYRPADPRVSLETTGGMSRPPMEATPASLEVFERAREIAAGLGHTLEGARVGGASDGNLTAAAGVPTLDGLGPAGAGAHARSEHVLVGDLPVRAALLAGILEDLRLVAPAESHGETAAVATGMSAESFGTVATMSEDADLQFDPTLPPPPPEPALPLVSAADVDTSPIQPPPPEPPHMVLSGSFLVDVFKKEPPRPDDGPETAPIEPAGRGRL